MPKIIFYNNANGDLCVISSMEIERYLHMCDCVRYMYVSAELEIETRIKNLTWVYDRYICKINSEHNSKILY